jgi:C-terminal processing protease CtpA/Prc
MRHATILVAPLAMFALASNVLAGGAECQKTAAAHATSAKHCTASKEECAKYMADAKNRGWVGIEYDSTEDGSMVVSKVVTGSPADKAGLKAGDVLFALNGVDLTEKNKDKLKAAKASMKPGSVVTYSIKRAGATEDVAVKLGTMPDDIYQAMVTDHMKEHVDVAAR